MTVIEFVGDFRFISSGIPGSHFKRFSQWVAVDS